MSTRLACILRVTVLIDPIIATRDQKLTRRAHASDLSLRQILGFTIGDFGCNLFWQSISLYLLFFYTDAVGLTASAAGLIYMVASIWDGITNPIMGAFAERTQSRWGKYRPYILLGAPFLCGSFVLAYYKPPLSGVYLIAFLLGSHVALRTCYAVVSIPYTSLSARLTSNTETRTRIAGFRMIFAMLASATVAYFTQPIVNRVGGENQAFGFEMAAAVFAAVALVVFPAVFFFTSERGCSADSHRPVALKEYWRSLRSNRAFWIVMIEITCVVGCVTAFGKSILYYFKYYLGDPATAHWALTWDSAAGLIILPCWMAVERHLGKRNAWFLGSALGFAGLAYFATTEIHSPVGMICFTVYMQIPLLGLAMTFWSMLPDTVEYGEYKTGVRAEALVFGLGQFILKVALGLGAGGLGLALSYVGFVPGLAQSAETLRGIRGIMYVFPLALLSIGFVAMYFYPLRRGAHEAIVKELASRRSLRAAPGSLC